MNASPYTPAPNGFGGMTADYPPAVPRPKNEDPLDMLDRLLEQVGARRNDAEKRMELAQMEEANARRELEQISTIHISLMGARKQFEDRPQVEGVYRG